jgi:hypothetical protein
MNYMAAKMKRGDLIRLDSSFKEIYSSPDMYKTYIVERVERANGWVFVYGYEGPIQMNLMEVVSERKEGKC